MPLTGSNCDQSMLESGWLADVFSGASCTGKYWPRFWPVAALTNGVAQTALLQTALDNYLDVFFRNNLHDGETADPYWVKEAGLDALPLVEALGTGDPNKFIDQMETWFPQMRDTLEKKRLEISRPKN